MIVIREAARALGRWRLIDTTLFVTLEPCAMCLGAILLARIPRLVFGARDPKAGACGSVLDFASDPRLNHRVEVVGGVLEEESQQMLSKFFKELRTQNSMAEPGKHLRDSWHRAPVRTSHCRTLTPLLANLVRSSTTEPSSPVASPNRLTGGHSPVTKSRDTRISHC